MVLYETGQWSGSASCLIPSSKACLLSVALAQLPWKRLRDWKIVSAWLNYLHLVHKTVVGANYGSGADHRARASCASSPFLSHSSPRTTFWLRSTPIQYKINRFHSRRLEMVGNILPPPLIIGNSVCVLNQQKMNKRKNINFSFSDVEASSANWPNTEFRALTWQRPLIQHFWGCKTRWGVASGERLGVLSWQ